MTLIPDKSVASKHTSSIKDQIKAEKKEMEEASAQAKKYSSSSREMTIEASPVVSGVLFKCPVTGSDEALPRPDMEKRIEEFLYSQLPEEPQLTSILMIHTLNKNKTQVKSCTEVLIKYLTNIIENPSNNNFKKIKSSNKVLNEKVLVCRGAIEFLQSVGFEKKKVTTDVGTEEEFYVLETEGANEDELTDKLKELVTALQECEPIEMDLHRDIKVFSPSQKDATKIQIPEDFYAVSSEEVKREQKLREECVKDMERLMTKDLRERERQQGTRKYQYAVIRVRFPDGFMIQGTFKANETFDSIRQFVLECLEFDWIPFNLCTSVGHKISEDERTITELKLAPASLLQFSFDQNVLKEIIQQDSNIETNIFLKNDLKLLALEI